MLALLKFWRACSDQCLEIVAHSMATSSPYADDGDPNPSQSIAMASTISPLERGNQMLYGEMTLVERVGEQSGAHRLDQIKTHFLEIGCAREWLIGSDVCINSTSHVVCILYSCLFVIW